MNPKYHAPFEEGAFYHLFNRANTQSDKLFFQDRNYRWFLRKWTEYLCSLLEVWAYCLLPNHFHFLVRVKSGKEATRGAVHPVSEALRGFAISYTQALNKQEQRRGSLFQKHPKHLRVTADTQIFNLIRYIHRNPHHHGIQADWAAWRYSSYAALLGDKPTRLERRQVIELFGGVESLRDFHREAGDDQEIADCLADVGRDTIA